MTTIVAMTEAHAEPARSIYNHWVLTSTATFAEEPVDAEEFAADSRFDDSPRHGSWVVLDDDGTLAGYVLLAPYKSRCAYRETAEVSVYLSPERTGQGLGGLALDHALAQAPGLGLHTLLATVCAENDASLRLFASRGFTEAARLREVGLKFGRRLDVVILQRPATA